jgi:hypothetical protein
LLLRFNLKKNKINSAQDLSVIKGFGPVLISNIKMEKKSKKSQMKKETKVERKEAKILKEIYPKLKPFLRQESIDVIEKQGTSITTAFGEIETPLINGADCAYVIFDDKKTALCGIEEAYNQGEVSWKKPVSCHLYPIRIKDYSEFSAVNYDKWEICDDACTLGKELGVPVYKFVKEALVRKFGEDWYLELEKVAKELEEK